VDALSSSSIQTKKEAFPLRLNGNALGGQSQVGADGRDNWDRSVMVIHIGTISIVYFYDNRNHFLPAGCLLV